MIVNETVWTAVENGFHVSLFPAYSTQRKQNTSV
jgi:hypothetical protein